MITLEYILIRGLNDSLDDADGLAAIARRLRAKVNLIACSPIEGQPFETPTDAEVARFKRWLEERKVNTVLRLSKGSDIAAACGQLAGRLKEEASDEKTPRLRFDPLRDRRADGRSGGGARRLSTSPGSGRPTLFPQGRPDEDRRLLLSRALAGVPMAARLRQDGRAWLRVHPLRGVRLGFPRTFRRDIRFCLARPGRRPRGPRRTEGHHVHPDALPAGLAGRKIFGDLSRRRRRPAPRARHPGQRLSRERRLRPLYRGGSSPSSAAATGRTRASGAGSSTTNPTGRPTTALRPGTNSRPGSSASTARSKR